MLQVREEPVGIEVHLEALGNAVANQVQEQGTAVLDHLTHVNANCLLAALCHPANLEDTGAEKTGRDDLQRGNCESCVELFIEELGIKDLVPFECCRVAA